MKNYDYSKLMKDGESVNVHVTIYVEYLLGTKAV